jgi:glycolate oxidase FAD binding subunit
MTIDAAAFAAIVGAAHVTPAQAADAPPGAAPRWVVAPGDAGEVAAVVRAAADAGLAVLPRGGGTGRERGNPPRRGDVVLALHRLDRLLEHAHGDMTATVEAGMPLAALQRQLAHHRQFVPLESHAPERATIGGVLATADSGALRLRYGPPRDLVLGMTVVLADGTIARSGGKVVKNVAGYDLPKLMTGALGTLGVLVAATLRLYPSPEHEVTVGLDLADPAALGRVLPALRAAPVAPTAVQLRLAAGQPTALDVRVAGTPAACDEQIAAIAAATASAPQPRHADVWQARAALWHEPALMLKCTTRPAQLGAALAQLAALTPTWRAVAYPTGIIEAALPTSARAAVAPLRQALAASDGAVVVLAGGGDLDAWGPAGDDFAVMQRIKQQFDPHGVFNPGRYLGGL